MKRRDGSGLLPLAVAWFFLGVIFGLFLAGAAAQAATCDVRVSAPADLQSRLNAAGRGKTVCLSGTFGTKTTVRPLAGQTIIGGTLKYTGSYNVCEGCDLTDGYDVHRTPGVTFLNVMVTQFEGRGILCGPHTTVRDSTLTYNRENGIGCLGDGTDWYVRIIHNVISHNGNAKLENHTSAGIKLLAMSHPGHPLGAGGIVQGNVLSDNIGNGMWWDRTSSAGIASGNTANGNTHSGIRIERGGGPFLIEHNTVRYNRDGISLRNAAKVTARDNIASGNERAMNVSYGGPDDLTYPGYHESWGYHPYDVRIEDTRMLSGKVLGCDISRVRCSA